MEEQPIDLDTEKKQKEVQKLEQEIKILNRNNRFEGRVLQFLPFLTTLVVVLGFVVGIINSYYTHKGEVERQKLEAEKQAGVLQQTKMELESKILEIEKQSRNRIYDLQIDTYLDLSNTAAAISATTNKNKREEKYLHFLELYNGSLRTMDSDGRVLDAAKKFDDLYTSDPSKQKELQESARYLGCATKTWVKDLWGIPKDKDPSEIKCL